VAPEASASGVTVAAAGTASTLRDGARRSLAADDDAAALTAIGERWSSLIAKIYGRHIADAAEIGALLAESVRGTCSRRDSIDRELAQLISGWAPDRQSAVDRNILRLAAYEILHRGDVPAPVAINEAVEIAKKYSTEDSGSFVNGVLGALATRAGLLPPTTDLKEGEVST
jgi:N utilization substance protein B